MYKYSLLFCLVFSFLHGLAQTYAIDYTVPVWGVTGTNNLTLHWPADTQAVSYAIYRKMPQVNNWGTAVAILAGNAISWTDGNTILGNYFEYKVQKTTASYTGYGYILGGIDRPTVEFRGRAVLVLDTTYKPQLAAKVDRLVTDWVGDGWEPILMEVDRSDAVAAVKARLVALHTANPLSAIFLLGHVPVPYSGNLNPDAHTDHKGAWPADVFYGEMNGAWGDISVNNTTATRTANHNIPGDGKYDPSLLPSDADVPVGRVDFYDLSSFAASEVQLLERYLDKEHQWRHKEVMAQERGVVDDNFGVFSYPPPNPNEYFAASGWRNFAPLVYPSNVQPGDFRTSLTNGSYMWAYGCGGGSYSSCSGVATTAQLAADSLNGVFNLLFGSYFGDWDSPNNLLRASIATRGLSLASAWAGRPQLHMHAMGLGEPIGAAILASQNNSTLYDPGYFARNVHIALMGDPTLRQHIMAPPSNLVVTSINGGSGFDLQWTASPDTNTGYRIYRSPNANGPWQLIGYVGATNFQDPCLLAGDYHYMVRAEELRVCASGRYYNLSQGIMGMGTSVNAFSVNFAPGPDTLLCIGNPFDVWVQTTGVLCGGGGLSVQLSDSTGDFSSGTVVGTDTGSTITCMVPNGIPTGTGYRLRLVVPSMGQIGPENGYDLRVEAPPAAAFQATVLGDSLILVQQSSGNYNLIIWDFGNGDTSHAAVPAYEYPTSGSFIVTMVVEGECGSDTATQSVQAVGLTNSFAKSPFRIWPQPASEELLFEGQEDFQGAWQWEIWDLRGQMVARGEREYGFVQGKVSVKEWPSGFYMLRILTESDMHNLIWQKLSLD